MAQAQPTPDGWLAELSLGFARRAGRTELVHRRRRGPLTVQRPFHPGDGACHVYLLHPPAGVVGGDALHVDVAIASRAHALVTTPGATRYYRSAGPLATQIQKLGAGPDAVLEWLPQENIFFRGCQARLHTRVDLAHGARLLLWDVQCFARPANGERFDAGHVDVGLSIYRDGQPLLLERQRHGPHNRERTALMAGRSVTGLLVASVDDDGCLEACRRVRPLDGALAVTQIDDLLTARYLGDSTLAARNAFENIWSLLRPQAARADAVPPRIWRT